MHKGELANINPTRITTEPFSAFIAEREALEPTLSENIIKLQITDNHALFTMQGKSKSF